MERGATISPAEPAEVQPCAVHGPSPHGRAAGAPGRIMAMVPAL